MEIFKFVSWNVNGIRAVEKKEALKWIDDNKIDILGLQEIKAQKEQVPKTIFNKKFKNFIVSNSLIKGRSGTALFSDIDIVYESECLEVDVLKEGRINEIHFLSKNKKIAFFNIYFPNGQSSQERLEYKMKFYDNFLNYCENLKKEGCSIIVCGDLNTAHKEIDLARPKENEKISGFLPIERDWVDKFISYGYIDTFRYLNGDVANKYSWWSYRTKARIRNVGWRIDYFFVSEDLKSNIKKAYMLDDKMGSDHCPVALEIAF